MGRGENLYCKNYSQNAEISLLRIFRLRPSIDAITDCQYMALSAAQTSFLPKIYSLFKIVLYV